MLSPEAIENDKRSGLPLIPLKEIYADKEFNCRGQITASDVVDLARDTAKRGLVEPVVIRHLWDSEEVQKRQGFKYSLVAGFRRQFAYRINEAEVIPCVIRAITSDFECRDLNAVENLQRQDLNILQEARSIQHYINASWSRDAIGKRVSKSPGWVQLRQELLQLPEEVQIAAAQNYLVQEDIKLLYKHRSNRNEVLRLAGIIRDRRKMGLKKDILAKVKVIKSAFEVKQRKTVDIQEIMNHIREMSTNVDRDQMIRLGDLISEQGNSILTRILGWACGNATNIEAHQAIKKAADLFGCDYKMPEFKESV
jgi:ParB family chromosome partitioning protein